MQITAINAIVDKIRTLCKQCNIVPIPHKTSQNQISLQALSDSLSALDELRTKVFFLRSLEEQYKKLEQCLQKNETEIRKHIGIQQQLKLYIDTLKFQYEESQNERLDLLDNSKKIIKQLKKENQNLFLKLQEKQKQSHLSKDKSKNKIKKGLDQYESKKNKLNTIGDLERSISHTKKKGNFSGFKIQMSDRHSHNKPLKKKDEKLLFDIKRKQQQNFTMMAYMSSHKKKVSKERQKTPGKKRLAGVAEGKINFTSGFKIEEKSYKKANKSLFSLSSADFEKEDKNVKENSDKNFL